MNGRMSQARTEVVFTARPSLRRAHLSLALSGSLLVIVFAIYYGVLFAGSLYYPPERISYDWTTVHFFAFAVCLFPGLMTGAAAYTWVLLTSERYIVTSEYIELRRGLVNRHTRLIPFSAIRDVSTGASFDQRLVSLGSVAVVATNGDRIALQDVTDYEAKREAIWRLVRK